MGVSDEVTKDGRWRIYAATRRGHAVDLAVYRAAEMAEAAGYPYVEMLGGQETRAAYFAQYGGDGPNGQGTKAAMIGLLLANAVETGSGVYGAATEHYLSALAHGSAPAFGSELALTYGAPVNLVGTTATPDPTVMT